jgi:hypothetical protein
MPIFEPGAAGNPSLADPYKAANIKVLTSYETWKSELNDRMGYFYYAGKLVTANVAELIDSSHSDYVNYQKEKGKLTAFIMQALGEEFKIRLKTNDKFQELLQDNNVYGLLGIIKSSATIASTGSVGRIFGQFFNIKYNNNISHLANQIKESIENAETLHFKDADEVFQALGKTVFIRHVSQDPRFKTYVETHLQMKPDYPPISEMVQTLRTYEANIEGSSMAQSKIEANFGSEGGGVDMGYTLNNQAYKAQAIGPCLNCGGKHLFKDCRKPKNTCEICGMEGHMTKFHDEAARIMAKRAERQKGTPTFTPKKTPPYKKSSSPYKKKLAAQLADVINMQAMIASQVTSLTKSLHEDSDLDEEEDEAIDLQNDFEEDIQGPYTDYNDVLSVNPSGLLASAMSTMVLTTSSGEVLYKIDSGCNGGHILQSDRLLRYKRDPAPNTRIDGFAGNTANPTSIGELLESGQKAMHVPNAKVDLLCLKEMLVGGLTAKFTFNSFALHYPNGSIAIIANDYGDGFWSITESQLIKLYGDSSKTQANNTNFLSAEEIKRAKEALPLCGQFGHPGPRYLQLALEHGLLGPTYLTAQDHKNCISLYGPCLACRIGKMKESPTPSSLSEPARVIGGMVHIDLIPLSSPSIGGNKFILFSVDEKCAYTYAIPIESKSAMNICSALDKLIDHYIMHKHRILKICSDDEASLRATKSFLNLKGIILSHTPAGLHERRAERYIQTLKARCRSSLAALSYHVDSKLYSELYCHHTRLMNATPNHVTGEYHSPHILFTGSKLIVPPYFFGQAGTCIHIRTEQGIQRAEHGIYVGFGEHARYLRVYLVGRHGVYSMRKFIPFTNNMIPVEWNLRSKENNTPTVPNTSNPMIELPTSRPSPTIYPPTSDSEPVQPPTSDSEPVQHPTASPTDPTPSIIPSPIISSPTPTTTPVVVNPPPTSVQMLPTPMKPATES